MWKKTENYEQFSEIISDLMADPEVLALADMPQHSKLFTRLDHSIYVAYLSFLLCRRLGLNHVSAARAGLLHDFHFADESDGIKRLWKHPKDALENAENKCTLTDMERDIILKHMWPLTPQMPDYRESFVVSLADKLCAMMEFSMLYKVFRVKKHLTRRTSAV